MVRKQLPVAHLALALSTLTGSAGMAFSQPATDGFTYQGELRTADSLFQGVADVRFTLWTAESGGSQLGAALQAQGISVSQGRFSVILNAGNEFAQVHSTGNAGGSRSRFARPTATVCTRCSRRVKRSRGRPRRHTRHSRRMRALSAA